jgi:hypothetical protein
MRMNRKFRTFRKPVKKLTPEQFEAYRLKMNAYAEAENARIAALPKPAPYLTPEDADAFLDLEKQENPVTRQYESYLPAGYIEFMKEHSVECPKCHGYGGWHLRINAYGEGQHFNCICSQCEGRGYVRPGRDVECLHDWQEVATVGNCLTDYACAKGCGATKRVDSSD